MKRVYFAGAIRGGREDLALYAALIARLREAGAKRVTLTAPVDTVIKATELPKCTGATVTYGGLEDD